LRRNEEVAMVVRECLQIQVPDLHCSGYFKLAREWELGTSVSWECIEKWRYFSGTVDRDSSDGIATGYGLDGPGIEFRWGRDFSATVQTGPGAHSASCTMGTGSFPGLKRPGRGVDHPPHLTPRLKKE
jgi:hypothetical protein